VVLKYRNDVSCSRILEELGPGLRIEVLGLEHRNEVLVTELGQQPIGSHVMFIDGRPFQIHLARIPLVSICWYGVQTPMDEDAKLCVPIPVRCLIVR
jgi:hypothetical protein